jgi:hypothetical protein
VRRRVPAAPVVLDESRAGSRTWQRGTSQANHPPNMAFQRTPRRVDKIRAFLTVRIGFGVVLIYLWRHR